MLIQMNLIPDPAHYDFESHHLKTELAFFGRSS
jgi:hypothetical protein